MWGLYLSQENGESMSDEIYEPAASVIVKIKESSTAKPNSEPAVEVTATDQATEEGRDNAVRHAVTAYFLAKKALEAAPKLDIVIKNEV